MRRWFAVDTHTSTYLHTYMYNTAQGASAEGLLGYYGGRYGAIVQCRRSGKRNAAIANMFTTRLCTGPTILLQYHHPYATRPPPIPHYAVA